MPLQLGFRKDGRSGETLWSPGSICFLSPVSSSVYVLKSSLSLLTGHVLLSSHDGIWSELLAYCLGRDIMVSIPDSWRRDCDLVWVRCIFVYLSLCNPSLVRPGGQGYQVAAGDQIFGCICFVIVRSMLTGARPTLVRV